MRMSIAQTPPIAIRAGSKAMYRLGQLNRR